MNRLFSSIRPPIRAAFLVWISVATLARVAPAVEPVGAAAEDEGGARVTFTRDVLPILQENCQACHRPLGANVMGMVAPMSFTTYEETRPWAKAIARQVAERRMPPWHAAPELAGVFANERTLTDEEVATLVSWARTGARRGPAPDVPAHRPSTSDVAPGAEWTLGEPDLVVAFDEPFFVDDSVRDVYETLVVTLTEDELAEDRWIQAMEFQPGSQAVHHIVIFTDDERESMGFPVGMLGGMGPGTDATVFPPGFGRLLRRGTTIYFNMHYHKEPGPGTGVWDHSRIAFKFHTAPVRHQVHWGAVGTMSFAIPPYAENFPVTARETFARDTLLLALFPHTHLRGKASRYTAFYPDGTQEVLLDVPRYDFNWQTNYIYKTPKRIPAGTRIEVTMWYDNSEARRQLAGIDPSRTVRWGQPTTDEMMYGWIDYCDAEPLPEEGAPGAGERSSILRH